MSYEEMFPCRAQIIRTRAGCDAAPLDNYSYQENTGEFTGTLTFRCWHRNKLMLLCHFDTDDGRRLKLPVWWKSWGVSYSPAESYISFADEVYDGVPAGTANTGKSKTVTFPGAVLSRAGNQWCYLYVKRVLDTEVSPC